jgi:uncharacterized membrane protein
MLHTIARGDGSRIVEPRRVVVRSETEWRAVWAAHAGPEAAEPPIDFTTTMIAAVFAGERPTPGYEIEILDSRREGTALGFVVVERQPPPGAIAAQMIVTPFHIAAVPRYGGDVRFVGPDESPRAAAAPRSRTPADDVAEPSTTGLDPTFAAALAYLAGPFSGVLILLAEKTNRYVTFHAWQAIIGLGGLAGLAILLLVFAFLTLFLSPIAFTILYRLAAAAGLAWIVAWMICLFKAFKGEAWKLPIAGERAERRSGLS